MTDTLALSYGAAATPLEDRPARRVAAVGVVMAVLLVVALQGWTPQLGLHRQAEPSLARSQAQPEAAATPELERVTHSVVPVAGRAGTFEVRDDAYNARFEASGFSYTPREATSAFGVSLDSLVRGDTPTAVAPGAWAGRANVAERSAAAGVLERVTARNGEVEWDVLLASPPKGSGDLVVGARLRGIEGAATRVQTEGGPAWRFGLTGGSSVQLDQMVVKDAHDAVLHRALPAVHGSQIDLVVPGAVLAGASYPLTIDPTVSAPVEVAPTGDHTGPSVAYSGNEYLVVWQEPDPVTGTPQIFGSRVEGDNSSAGPAFEISDPANTVPDPSPTDPTDTLVDVAWNGSNFLVVYHSLPAIGGQVIAGRLVTAAGVPSGSEFPVSNDATSIKTSPTVAALDPNTVGGSTWVVVWSDNRNNTTTSSDIYGRQLATTGTPIDLDDVPISTGTFAEIVPDLAANGDSFLVAWQIEPVANRGGVFARRVTPGLTGLMVEEPEIVVAFSFYADAFTPAVASDGTNFLVVVKASFSGDPGEILAFRFDNMGTLLGGTQVSSAPGIQSDPAVTFQGYYFVAWRDERNGTTAPDIYGARVTTKGDLLDNGGFPVANSATAESAPAVAPHGRNSEWAVDYLLGPDGANSIEQRIAST